MKATLSAKLKSTAFVTIGIGALMTSLSCSNSASSSIASGATPVVLTSMGGAVSKAISTASKNAPHVVNAATVTAANDRQRWFRNFVMNNLMPRALATDQGLNSVWDPQNGNAPSGSDAALLNAYIGNGYTCSGNSCSGSGLTTVPENISVKSYMGQKLDPNFQNSNGAQMTPFGRLNSAMQVACVLGYLFTTVDADGTPSVGTPAVSFPSDTTNVIYKTFANGGCGMDPSQAGQSINPSVTAVTGSSHYTKKISVSVGGNSNSIYLGMNLLAGDLDIMMTEDQAANGRNAVSRSILSAKGMISPATTNLKFEYFNMGYLGARGTATAANSCLSGGGGYYWQISYEFHRLFIDGAGDVAYIMSNTGDPGSTDANGCYTAAPGKYIQFSAAGKPLEISACSSSGCDSNLALSLAFDGQYTPGGGLYSSAGNAYNACVNVVSRAIATNASLSCDVTGSTVTAASAIEASRQFLAQTTGGTVNGTGTSGNGGVPNVLTNSSGSTTVSFTGASDFFTAAVSQ